MLSRERGASPEISLGTKSLKTKVLQTNQNRWKSRKLLFPIRSQAAIAFRERHCFKMKPASCMSIRPHHVKFFEELKTQGKIIRQPNLSPLRMGILNSDRKSLPSLILFHMTRWSTNQWLCLTANHHWRVSEMMTIMMFERNQVLSFTSATCSPSEGSYQQLTGQTSAKPC